MITLQQTTSDQEGPSEEVKAFFGAHTRKGPSHVVCVEIRDEDGDTVRIAVFSDLDQAAVFVAEQPEDFMGQLFPLIIDNPEFGNATVN